MDDDSLLWFLAVIGATALGWLLAEGLGHLISCPRGRTAPGPGGCAFAPKNLAKV